MNYTIICLIYAILAYKTERKFFNPITIFSTLWTIIIFFSKLRLYTLYETSNRIYFIMICGITALVIGYYLTRLLSNKKGFKLVWNKSKENNFTFKVNYRICYFFSIVCLVYIIYSIAKLGSFKAGFNLRNIGKLVNNANSNSSLINMVSFIIINPMFLSILIVECVDLWNGKKDKLLLIFSILIIIGRMLITGGRVSVIQFFIALIISYVCSNKTNLIKAKITNLKNNIKIIGLITIAVILFLIISLTVTKKLFKTIYLDFAMQPYMFQYWSENIGEERAYGFASTFGVYHPIIYITKNILNLNDMPQFFRNIYNNIQMTFDNWVPIGKILKANAYTSIFWYFYYDGGGFGIILGMFILGIISFDIFSRVNNDINIKNIGNYIFLLLLLIYTFTDMELYKASFVLAILYYNCVLIKKEKGNDF